MNMKDLLPKTFTCFKRDNMEIYDSITYVEPFSLPGVQNRKRYWNVTLPSGLVNCQLLLRMLVLLVSKGRSF